MAIGVHHELRRHAGYAQRLPQGAIAFGGHAENVDVRVLAGDGREVLQARAATGAARRVQQQQAAPACRGKGIFIGTGLLAFAKVFGEGCSVFERFDGIHVAVPRMNNVNTYSTPMGHTAKL